MDKLEKVRTEIERIQLYTQSGVLKQILDFIDSLQEEPVNKQKLSNVERTVKDWKEEPIIEVLDRYLDRVPDEEVLKTKIAINEWFNVYFPKLQEEPVSEDLEKAAVEAFKEIVDTDKNNFLEIFKAGAEWQIAKLMKDAIDVTVHIEAGNYPYIPQLELYDYDKDEPLAKKGDKYKVILIKED